MKLCTYQGARGPRVGVVVEDRLVDAGFDGPMTALIAGWGELRPRVEQALEVGDARPLSQVTLLAPVLRPGKIFAIGLNYADHIAESQAQTPEPAAGFVDV